jgi:hypothetical protein
LSAAHKEVSEYEEEEAVGSYPDDGATGCGRPTLRELRAHEVDEKAIRERLIAEGALSWRPSPNVT